MQQSRKRAITAKRPVDAPVEPHIVSIAVKAWLICEIDTIAETFDCQFVVLLEWFAPAAKGLAECQPVPQETCESLGIPRLTIRNAVEVFSVERDVAPIVVDRETGHVALRIHYHARLHFVLDLSRFPFDAQWLTVRLQLDEVADKGR